MFGLKFLPAPPPTRLNPDMCVSGDDSADVAIPPFQRGMGMPGYEASELAAQFMHASISVA